jgi:3-methyladenine DNA glycosylase AlkD
VQLDPVSAADSIEAELAAVGTPERAAQEQRYLKSELAFRGATVGQIRAVAKAFVQAHHELSHDQLVSLVEALWGEPVHERRMAAIMLLELKAALLSPADLPLLERLARESRTWALIDQLAVDAVGGILARHRAKTAPVLDRWAADPDFWLRRTSLLAELRPLRDGADASAFLRRADAMLDEREFFIRKAIGWVLRELGKRRPDEVVAWLAPRAGRASGVTMREAVRHLPAADARRLTEAYRARRAATVT